jgi:hypothetical protein
MKCKAMKLFLSERENTRTLSFYDRISRKRKFYDEEMRIYFDKLNDGFIAVTHI